ncbi:DinB family protein [Paenibacillus chartarius]|uniref:DinB family protein n=1 Tax=Paenibacillus chartarius TaxID=747481 RepID=A0ABV6DS61_9BACL
MYNSIQEVTEDLLNEAYLTQKVLEALSDASLAQPSAAGHRTLGELAWHLVTAHGAILGEAGLKFEAPVEEVVPASAAELAESYKKASEAAVSAIKSQWTDATLQESRNMWGMMEFTVPGLIAMFIRHQAHHRGQLTVLMRLAGLKVPGVYGPSQEEWAAMGAGAGQ